MKYPVQVVPAPSPNEYKNAGLLSGSPPLAIYSTCKTFSESTKLGEEEFLNDLIEGMFMKPNASNLSPQISTNCCLDLSVKPNPNESTKYLKSKVSLLTSDLNKGVPLENIIDKSVNEVMTRSLNTSITTLLAVLAILVYGGDTLKTFMVTLLVGIGIGTYSSIFVASPIVYLLEGKFKNKVK